MKVKSNLLLFFITLALLTSCKTDNLKEVLEKSETPQLDLAYYTVVKSEMDELGSSIAIVDRTLDTTSIKLNGIVPRYANSEKTIYWKREIFPRANYVNGDRLESYLRELPEEYWELGDQYKSGWIELTTPYFTEDKKKVLIEVYFFQGSSFGSNSYYLLEWIGEEYVIKEKGLISIS